MFYKRLTSLLILILFFIIVWYMQGRYLLSNPNLETLIYLNNSASCFNSLMAYAVLYTIPYLLFYRQWFQEESALEMTRYRTREKILKLTGMRMLAVTLIFVLAMLGVHFYMTNLFFEKSVLIEANFVVISMVNSLSLYFFYIIVGLSYVLINTKVRTKTIALFIVFLLFSVEFFAEKQLFSGKFRTLLTEISLFSQYYYQDISLIDLLLKGAFLSLVALVLYSITSLAYSRKDFFGNE